MMVVCTEYNALLPGGFRLPSATTNALAYIVENTCLEASWGVQSGVARLVSRRYLVW